MEEREWIGEKERDVGGFEEESTSGDRGEKLFCQIGGSLSRGY